MAFEGEGLGGGGEVGRPITLSEMYVVVQPPVGQCSLLRML